jgi:hypothetical protein
VSDLDDLLDGWEARRGFTRCQGCHWDREGLKRHQDARGAAWWLCEKCLPDAEAEKARQLEARRRAKDARERERVGQLRLDGTGEAAPMRARQERLL